jgi:carboxypeptidase Taq
MQDPHNPAPKDSHPHRQATCRPAHGEQAIVRRDLAELKQRLSEIYDLTAAGSVLTWDEATYMPKGGTVARGRQSSMLRRLAHERFVDPALGRLIDRLEPGADKLPADDASLIRIVRRDYERAIRVPAEYVARANAHGSAS